MRGQWKERCSIIPIHTHSPSECYLRGPRTPSEEPLQWDSTRRKSSGAGREYLRAHGGWDGAQGEQGLTGESGHWVGSASQLPRITHWQYWFPGLWISENLASASAAHSWALLPPHGLWRSGGEAHFEQKIPSWCCRDMQHSMNDMKLSTTTAVATICKVPFACARHCAKYYMHPLTTSRWERWCPCQLHFTEDNAGAQRDSVTCPRSHS